MTTFFYKLFYSHFINSIFRNIFFPFRKQLPKKFKIPITGVVQVKDAEMIGSVKFYSNEACPMVRHLFWEESLQFTFEYSEIFKSIVSKSKSFIDIGSNVGYYSLLASKLNPSMTILAVEPSKGPNFFLRKNIELNGFKNIQVIEKAIDQEEGTISFYEEKRTKYTYLKHHASGIGNTINSWNIQNYVKYEVEKISLSEIVKANSITNVDLIKIDTEGTEDKILLGGIDVIQQHSPIIICEILKDDLGDKIQDIFTKHVDYSIFQFIDETGKLIEVENLGSIDKQIDTNFFFVPKTQLNKVSKFL